MDGRAARTASLLLWACFALVVGFLGLRRLWQALSFPCSQLCAAPSLDAGAAATLQSHGISLAQYAWASVLAIGLLMAGSLVLAAAVARFGRSSAGAAAVLVAVAASMANPPGPGGTGIAGRICTTAAQLGILWLFAAFPRTRLRPDWLWLPVACGSVWAVGSLWIPALRSAIDAEQFPWVPLEGLIFVAAFATIAVGRIRAYPKESPTVRRQLRLVLAALVLLCLVGVAGSLSTAGLDGAGAGSLAGAAWFHVGSGALVLVVAAMGAAFTSHNAWGSPILLSAATARFVRTGLLVLAGAVLATGLMALLAGPLPWLVATFTTAVALLVLLPATRRLLYRSLPGGPTENLGSALATVLAEAGAPSEVIPVMEVVLAGRLRLSEVRIRAPQVPPAPPAAGQPSTVPPLMAPEAGRTGTDCVQLCDPVSGSPVAQLEATLRPGRRQLSRREIRAMQAAVAPIAAGLALVRLTHELQESRTAVETVREQERKVLRSTLHDEVVPTLAIARHRISAALSGTADTQSHLKWAEMSVGSAIEQLRLMARTLLPSMVSTHGFADAVEYFVVGVKTPVSLRLHLDNVVPQAVELAAYQVLVEAVLNAERHARATTITVDLSTDADTLILSVADNGVGILPECVPGLGLASMREAVLSCGGELTVAPTLPTGTTVLARLPHRQVAAP